MTRRRRVSRDAAVTFGPSTERSSSVPVTIWIQYEEWTSLSVSAFRMAPSRNTRDDDAEQRAAAAEDRDAAEQHAATTDELEARAALAAAREPKRNV